jgi:hypothetical protein
MRLGEPDLEWQIGSQNRRTVGNRAIDEVNVVDVHGEADTMSVDVTEALGLTVDAEGLLRSR